MCRRRLGEKHFFGVPFPSTHACNTIQVCFAALSVTQALAVIKKRDKSTGR